MLICFNLCDPALSTQVCTLFATTKESSVYHHPSRQCFLSWILVSLWYLLYSGLFELYKFCCLKWGTIHIWTAYPAITCCVAFCCSPAQLLLEYMCWHVDLLWLYSLGLLSCMCSYFGIYLWTQGSFCFNNWNLASFHDLIIGLSGFLALTLSTTAQIQMLINSSMRNWADLSRYHYFSVINICQ